MRSIMMSSFLSLSVEIISCSKMIDLFVGSMSKDELNLPEGLKMSLISRHTLNIFKKKTNKTPVCAYMSIKIYCKLK